MKNQLTSWGSFSLYCIVKGQRAVRVEATTRGNEVKVGNFLFKPEPVPVYLTETRSLITSKDWFPRK